MKKTIVFLVAMSAVGLLVAKPRPEHKKWREPKRWMQFALVPDPVSVAQAQVQATTPCPTFAGVTCIYQTVGVPYPVCVCSIDNAVPIQPVGEVGLVSAR